jgi:flagellar basal body-associated protein FliL
MPLVMLVVLGQASIAYLLINKIVIQRLAGPAVDEVEEVKVDIAIGDEPERVYQEMGEFIVNPADTVTENGLRYIKTQISLGISPPALTANSLPSSPN